MIAFGSGLTISWSGRALGSIAMSNINVTGDVGAQFDIDATFHVADVDHLTNFTRVCSSFDVVGPISKVFYVLGIANRGVFRMGYLWGEYYWCVHRFLVL